MYTDPAPKGTAHSHGVWGSYNEHEGIVDWEAMIAMCACGFKACNCRFKYEMREKLEKHWQKVGTWKNQTIFCTRW